MCSSMRLAFAAMMAVGISGLANAQAGTNGWFFECIDPMNMTPYSADYGTIGVRDALFGVRAGVTGTVTYGGTNGPCYGPTARTLRAEGRLSFLVGATGSLQTSFDDNLALTVGSPTDPVGDYCFGKILKDGDKDANSVLYGSNGLRTAYVGASKRYLITAWGDADVDVELQVKILGDAARLRWRMRNLKADAQALGLFFACYPGMRTENAGISDSTGANQADSLLATATGNPKRTTEGYIGFITLPTGKPVRNWRRYDVTNPKFPAFANFNFGQTDAYGMHIDNIPPSYTPDATSADLFLIGNHEGPVASLMFNNTVRTVVAGDVETNPSPNEEADIFLNEACFLQRFPAQLVGPGLSRDVVHYVRAPWGVADYTDPYTAVIDAPRLIATDTAGVNGLSPNPFSIRAYVDNQYSTLDKEVSLHQVRMTIFLPNGLTLGTGEAQQKTLDLVQPNEIAAVNWTVVSDGKVFGDLPYQIKIEPTPGPSKILNGIIKVSATPKIELQNGANLVTIPYTFQDSSMDKILGMQTGVDYTAFRYDPDQSQYIPALTVDRGIGYWILPKTNLGFKPLTGGVLPADQATGGLLVSLHQGWNLIGNPYSYAIPLNQLVLVVEDSPQDSYTWTDAVSNNFVQSSLIYWNKDDSLPGGGTYNYTNGSADNIQPHRGYWIYVSTFKPVRISWPAVFAEGLPNSGRKPSKNTIVDPTWSQGDRQWRLQLSARTVNGIDSQNYVGVASDKKVLTQNVLRKAPASPGQNVELSIEDTIDGAITKLTQALVPRTSTKEWTLNVKAREAGDVTVTWPNLASMPRNLRFKITDPASGESHDLRNVSGYTFRLSEPGVRKLKISVEPGGSSRPVIGQVVVTRSGGAKSASAPVSVSYSLSTDANVTVRVLSNLNKEINTISMNKPVSSGQNTATWTLRDSANRTVAPGQYNIEIVAETLTGERVRRIVPVTISR